jgi:hypothetical protein
VKTGAASTAIARLAERDSPFASLHCLAPFGLMALATSDA